MTVPVLLSILIFSFSFLPGSQTATANGPCLIPTDAGNICRDQFGTCDVAEICECIFVDPFGCLTVFCPDDSFKSSGFECRASTGVCDLTETCTGTSATCPTNAFEPDGLTCDDGDDLTTADQCTAGVCTGSVSCGDDVVQAGEECEPPGTTTCDDTCKFVTSSSGTVVGTTEVPQFCGIKQLAVETPAVFDENIQPIIFDETVDLQASNEETLRVANTGGGAAEVNADLTLLDSDGETTDWEDLAGDTFDRSNTRWHHLSSQPYSSMTPITDNPFIDVLPGQTSPESEFVDRFLKVRPDVGDAAFSGAGVDLITFTQVLRLEVSCDPVAACEGFFVEDNGECVLD